MALSKVNRYYYRVYLDDRDSRNPVPNLRILSDVNTSTLLASDVKTLSINKDWRIKLRSKVDVSQPYTRTVTSVRGKTSFAKTFTSNPFYTSRSFSSSSVVAGLLSTFPSNQDSSLKELALSRIKAKIQKHSGAYNVMIPVAELKDLHGLVRSAADLSLNFVKTLKDIKKTKGKSARQWASKAWLTYSFGISPLVSEVNSSINSIRDFLERQDHNAVLTGTAEKDWFTGSRDYQSDTGPLRSTLKFDVMLHHQLSYKWTGGFYFPVSAANNYTAIEHFGLSVGNLLPVAWELIPYSWVIDYFTNVGQFLEDTFSSVPGQSVYLTCSRHYRVNGSSEPRYVLDPIVSPTFVSFDGVSTSISYWDHFEMERTVHSSLPMTSLRIKTVDEVARNSISKLLNLLSIVGK